ncbi:hypothetical protein KO481_34155 [Nocardia sp. NEAU-G5]|uniref:Uncharacterized protein n=1 Tax=Nocardia albiluteola TaxID=2842303 RepID=A0ABS6BAW8_9NOCA|nr:hypothetical protein [Nocardia albiluteola]MBU3066550.1 hypothetical protein [Nocardia albiluteola]
MLFDIRTIVGALMGLYGIVLIIVGAMKHSAADLARSGGWNVNLWSGVAMAVLGVGFLVWVRLRPTQIPPSQPIDSAE